MAGAPIVFHLPGSVLRDPAGLMKPYYRYLTEGLQARGARVEFLVHERDFVPAQVASDDGFHIVDHGGHRHARVLNTGIAYVYPFWNLDPWGIRALSSIAAKVFDPAALDVAEVSAFTARLRKRLVGARASRYPQPEGRADIAQGCIAVFAQSEGHRHVDETCHLDFRTMVAALLARDDPRPIVIKPHPRDHAPETRDYLTRLAARDARVRVVDANIHDILAAAAVTVTINSATGIESMLHGVPVILCGKSDFHHAAITVTTPAAMEGAIAQALGTPWPHDAFLYWYFALNCLNAGKPSLVDDFLARIAATGFALDRLGLAGGDPRP